MYGLKVFRWLPALLIVACLATSTPAKACSWPSYPCFNQVVPSAFSADQYAYTMAKMVGGMLYTTTMPAPPAPTSPYLWQQPYPYVSTFSGGGSFSEPDDTGCTAGDAYVSGIPGAASQPMRVYNGGSPYPSTFLIPRGNPTYIQRTVQLTNVRGIGLQARFAGGATTGGANANGHVLTQTVYYHSQRCYTAGTEFGFARSVNGNVGGNNDGGVTFWYSIYTNCGSSPPVICKIGGTMGTDGTFQAQQGGYNIGGTPTATQKNITIPSGTNSHGGLDWLYEAWLKSSGAPYTWNINVVDPYSGAPAPGYSTTPITLSVQSFFNTSAAQMLTTAGLSGYMTITTNLNTQWTTPPSPTSNVELDVVNLFAP